MPAPSITAARTTSLERSTSKTLRCTLAILATVAVAAVAAPISVSAAPAPTPPWAPALDATIHPGVQTYTDGGQCTANFVFHDAADVYIGQAAHCSGTDGNTATNGCSAGSLPLGTPVEVMGASRPGTMVYNSWLAMQDAGETDPNACQYNDFALIKLDPADRAKVNPTVPVWGGPVGVGSSTGGESVYSYGNSSLRLGLGQLSPKTGVSLGEGGGGWTHAVYTVSPGVPGDSGSAFLNSKGEAIGTLSTLALAPLPASNGVADLGHALDYLADHSALDVQLALGTADFNGNALKVVTSLLSVGF